MSLYEIIIVITNLFYIVLALLMVFVQFILPVIRLDC